MGIEIVRFVGGLSPAGVFIRILPKLVRSGARIGMALSLLVLSGAGAAGKAPDSTAFAKGYEAYQRGEFGTAMDIWEPLAEAGDLRALYNLGVIYAEGRGVRADKAKAVDLWKRAAEAGHVRAMHNLALTYIAGVPDRQTGAHVQKYDSAMKWLKKAANKNFANSIYSLGQMYQYGLGVKQSTDESGRRFRAAATSGFAKAQFQMARRFAEGRGVEKDPAEALKWYLIAARRGHKKARASLEELIVNASLADLREAAERARAFEAAAGEKSAD